MRGVVLVVRWLAPLSALLTALFFDTAGAAVMMLVCLATTIMWRARLPAALELTTNLVLLVAAWSSVFLLYERFAQWDLVVHFAATGVLAELAFRALERWGRLRAPGYLAHVAVVTGLGTMLALLWEGVEFAGYALVDPNVQVGYLDTMGDLAAGGLGSLVIAIIGIRARHGAGASARVSATPAEEQG